MGKSWFKTKIVFIRGDRFTLKVIKKSLPLIYFIILYLISLIMALTAKTEIIYENSYSASHIGLNLVEDANTVES